MAKGATGLRERTLDKAALHYEAAIRLFRCVFEERACSDGLCSDTNPLLTPF
jgi:hypothetical protein